MMVLSLVMTGRQPVFYRHFLLEHGAGSGHCMTHSAGSSDDTL